MIRAFILLFLFPTLAWAETPRAAVPGSSHFGSPCPYPDAALTTRSEGTTWLSYRGTRDGTVEDAKVIQSSGNTDLDEAAVQCLSHWQFDPDTERNFHLGTRNATITWRVPEHVPGSATEKSAAGTFTGVPHSCFDYYPDAELAAGIEGTTLLQFTVTEAGEVREPTVAQSSGNKNLDDAALRCVRGWRYLPAVEGNKPIAVTWKTLVVWKVEVPQTPSLAEPHQDCAHSYPVKPEDLVGIDGTTEVMFEIVRGEVEDARVTHSSGNAVLDRAAVACINSRHYVRETVVLNNAPVDKYRSMTIRERITWSDALKATPSSMGPTEQRPK